MNIKNSGSGLVIFGILLLLVVSMPTVSCEENITNNNINLNVTAIFSGNSADQQLSMEVMKAYPNINFNAYSKIPNDLDLSTQDLILLDLYQEGVVALIEDTVNDAKNNNNATVVVLSPLTEKSLALSTVNNTDHPYINQYFTNGGPENHKRLFKYLLVNFFEMKGSIEDPVVIPKVGIYHPDSSEPFANVTEYLQWYGDANGTHHTYNPDKPTAVILFHTQSYLTNTSESIDKMVREFEDNGVNCVAQYGQIGDQLDLVINTSDNTPNLPIDVVIKEVSYRVKDYSDVPVETGVEYLETLDVPVINVIAGLYQTTPEQWKESPQGIPISLIGTRITLPELDGAIEPIIIAGELKDPTTEIYHSAPIDEQIEWLIERTSSWIKLQKINNEDKKVSLIYYHHASGKGEVGVMDEGGLDTHASLVNVLKALENEGYDVGDHVPDINELRNMMQSQGKNIGVWAPSELDKMVETGNVTLIPKNEYMEWFDELPETKRNEVIERWGEPPGEVMVYENETGEYIVIPNIEFGNILLAPQPMRGKGQNDSVMFYDEAVVPHHQYIAFYMWVNKQYQTDAIVHFGTYGSFEYLPGKQTGLDVTSCWPAILIQDMPHLYLYTTDGTAGATQAKRRSNAVIIDYLTPPLVSSGLYGNLSLLSDDLQMYDQAGDDIVKQRYRENIIEKCRELNLHHDLNVNLTSLSNNATEFEIFRDDLENYLYVLKNQYMPYGLHTLGEPPENDGLVSMVISMLGTNFKQYTENNSISENDTRKLVSEVIINGTSPKNAQNMVIGNTSDNMTLFLNTSLIYSENLEQSTNEISSLISGLNGEYISPGLGGDPVRTPNAIPTGKNLYSFRSDKIPSEVTWDIGVESAEQLLDKYYAENGEYPQKVAVNLWATETMKHLGVMESQILYLMGVEPVWSPWGSLSGVELIPAEELGRPRVDVIVVPSGVYRDTFPEKLTFIDKSVRRAAKANDTSLYPNYINQSSSETYEWLIDNGYNDSEALNYSRSRIFSASSGSYGPSISVPIGASGSWEDDSVIGNYFIDGWGFAYGENTWGSENQEVFRQNLDGVDLISHSISSNNYGVLYGDGYFSSIGGLALAVKTVSGDTPEMYLNNLRNLDNPVVENLDQFLIKEMRTRNLNPEWIKGMMENDYYGSSIMSSGFENLWGWEVTAPDIVTDEMWDEMYEVYIEDKHDLGLKEHFNEKNPWARQSMLARMIEAERKGYWDASDQVLEELTKEYVESVADNDVTCCHHTCGNPTLDEYVEGLMSVAGVSSESQDAYKKLMDEATHRPKSSTPSSSSSSGGVGSAKIVNTSSTGSASNQTTSTSDGGYGESAQDPTPDSTESSSDYVEGYEMEKEEPKDEASGGSSFSGADIVGTILVLAAVGAMYIGFRRRQM